MTHLLFQSVSLSLGMSGEGKEDKREREIKQSLPCVEVLVYRLFHTIHGPFKCSIIIPRYTVYVANIGSKG